MKIMGDAIILSGNDKIVTSIILTQWSKGHSSQMNLQFFILSFLYMAIMIKDIKKMIENFVKFFLVLFI